MILSTLSNAQHLRTRRSTVRYLVSSRDRAGTTLGSAYLSSSNHVLDCDRHARYGHGHACPQRVHFTSHHWSHQKLKP
eukprot:3603646-Prymnesium_polylepis.1